MRKSKKLMVCLTLGAMMMGNMGVNAAEAAAITATPGTATTGEGLVYDSDDLNKDIDAVTTIVTYNETFAVSGEPNDYSYGDGTYEFTGSYVKGGKWVKDKTGWYYRFSDGTYPNNASIIIDPNNIFSISSWKDYKEISVQNIKESSITKIYYDNSFYTKTYNVAGTDEYSAIRADEIYGKKYNKKIYSFDEKGYLITSQYMWNHWIDENGELQIRTGKSGTWKHNKKGWWYQLSDGSYLKDGFYVIYENGWVKRSQTTSAGKAFYFDKNGYAAVSKFVRAVGIGYSNSSSTSSSTGRGLSTSVGSGVSQSVSYADCYVWADKNGYLNFDIPYRWQKNSKGWWFGTTKEFGGNWYAKNQWLNLDNKWYYFDNKGYMVTGTKVIDGKTYTFNKNGVWVK